MTYLCGLKEMHIGRAIAGMAIAGIAIAQGAPAFGATVSSTTSCWLESVGAQFGSTSCSIVHPGFSPFRPVYADVTAEVPDLSAPAALYEILIRLDAQAVPAYSFVPFFQEWNSEYSARWELRTDLQTAGPARPGYLRIENRTTARFFPEGYGQVSAMVGGLPTWSVFGSQNDSLTGYCNGQQQAGGSTQEPCLVPITLGAMIPVRVLLEGQLAADLAGGASHAAEMQLTIRAFEADGETEVLLMEVAEPGDEIPEPAPSSMLLFGAVFLFGVGAWRSRIS